MKYACVAAFLATILLANYLTTELGDVTLFGVTATAGTLLAGLSFVLRDTLQDTLGKAVTVALIVTGAGLSFAVSAPAIAVASMSAFLLAELADLLVYTPLRRHGYVRAAVASNVVGSVVDTFVFLWLAAPFLSTIVPGFSVTGMAPEQIVGKLAVTVVAVAGVLVYRTHQAKRLAAHHRLPAEWAA